jgi:hypothetical protein
MKEKRFVHFSFYSLPLEQGGIQKKAILEIIGMDTGTCYGSALWINGTLQNSYWISPFVADRLMQKFQNKKERFSI